MANIEHSAIADANRHEPKGASTAVNKTVPTSDGAGGTSFSFVDYLDVTNTPAVVAIPGWWNYNDTATASTPITIPTPGTFVDLTNDGLGVVTDTTFAQPTGTDIWNVSTNRLDLSNLSVGDTVDIRIDVEVTTTTVNALIDLQMEFGLGVSPFTLAANSSVFYKSSGVYQIVPTQNFFIGSTLVKDNPARIMVTSDVSGTTVVVNGWFIKVTRNG